MARSHKRSHEPDYKAMRAVRERQRRIGTPAHHVDIDMINKSITGETILSLDPSPSNYTPPVGRPRSTPPSNLLSFMEKPRPAMTVTVPTLAPREQAALDLVGKASRADDLTVGHAAEAGLLPTGVALKRSPNQRSRGQMKHSRARERAGVKECQRRNDAPILGTTGRWMTLRQFNQNTGRALETGRAFLKQRVDAGKVSRETLPGCRTIYLVPAGMLASPTMPTQPVIIPPHPVTLPDAVDTVFTHLWRTILSWFGR